MLFLVEKNNRHQYGILNTDDLSLTWVNKNWVQNNLQRIANYIPRFTYERLNIMVDGINGFFEYRNIQLKNLNYMLEDFCIYTKVVNTHYTFTIWFNGYRHVIEATIPYLLDYMKIDGFMYELKSPTPCCFLYRLNKSTVKIKSYMTDIVINSNGSVSIGDMYNVRGTKESYQTFKRNIVLK